MYLVIANTFGVDIDQSLKDARKGRFGEVIKEARWVIPEEYDDVNVSIKRLLADYKDEDASLIYQKAKEFIEMRPDTFHGIIVIDKEVSKDTIKKYSSLIKYFKHNYRNVFFIPKQNAGGNK